MEIKKRVKNIKEKLKAFGYDVKHTHCREIFAIAHGYRNAHQLPDRNKNLSKALDVFLPKELHLTTRVMPNTTNEYYSEKVYGAKVYLNQMDINDLIEARNFLRDRDFTINLTSGAIDPFENFNEDYFASDESLENLMDELFSGETIFCKELYNKDNCFLSDGEYHSHVEATKDGIYIYISTSDKHQEVIFSSYLISWKELDLENKS